MNFETIGTIIAILGSITAILLPLLKRKHEIINMDADSMQKFNEAANLAVDRANEIEKDFKEYKDQTSKRMRELTIQLMELQQALQDKSEELEDLKDWAERLVHQVQSLGHIPVAMRPKKK